MEDLHKIHQDFCIIEDGRPKIPKRRNDLSNSKTSVHFLHRIKVILVIKMLSG